jgi:hypothetical protein
MAFSSPLLVTVMVGGLSYGVALWLTGFLSDDEQALIKQTLRHWRIQQWAG